MKNLFSDQAYIFSLNCSFFIRHPFSHPIFHFSLNIFSHSVTHFLIRHLFSFSCSFLISLFFSWSHLFLIHHCFSLNFSFSHETSILFQLLIFSSGIYFLIHLLISQSDLFVCLLSGFLSTSLHYWALNHCSQSGFLHGLPSSLCLYIQTGVFASILTFKPEESIPSFSQKKLSFRIVKPNQSNSCKFLIDVVLNMQYFSSINHRGAWSIISMRNRDIGIWYWLKSYSVGVLLSCMHGGHSTYSILQTKCSTWQILLCRGTGFMRILEIVTLLDFRNLCDILLSKRLVQYSSITEHIYQQLEHVFEKSQCSQTFAVVKVRVCCCIYIVLRAIVVL